LGDHLVLLQSLIAVDASLPGEEPISPATLAGISSLSSLCGQARELRVTRQVRQCVFDCSEDLCHLIERVQLQQKTENEVAPWVRITLAMLPLLDVLSNVRVDGTVFDPTFHLSVTSQDAQWLLSSGLFRELVMLAAKVQPVSDAERLARNRLFQSLQVLSLLSMPLLGRYAWRVPEFSSEIHAVYYQKQSLFDSVIWQLMGTHLAGGSVLRMKGSPITTVDNCREAYRKGLEVCSAKIVESLSLIRSNQTECKADFVVWKEPIINLTRFTNCLGACPSLSDIWRKEMSEDIIEDFLKPIRASLSTLASVRTEPDHSPEKSAENDKAGSPMRRPLHSDEVAMVRRSEKILALSLEKNEARLGLTSKTD
jgi:hypothetical protein